MLFRTLIATYGASLAGKSAAYDDPVWHLGQSEELWTFRTYALSALQKAKVYLLDHAAASYADTLHDTIDERRSDKDGAALTFLGEVKPPADLVWVEFDYRDLVATRVQRNSPSIVHLQNPSGTGLRGYLIDARDVEVLRVTMFSCDGSGRAIDPFLTLYFDKSDQGGNGLTSVRPRFHQYMLEAFLARGMKRDELEAHTQLKLVDAASDLFIPYALFAMLVSPDLGGIIPTEEATYSAKEMRTARKFGKSWIAGAPKSHLTIRIGPQAANHMQERLARLEFERVRHEDRNSPVRHWVSEHERHYQSGKVVLIKGHHRGQRPGPSLPTRVMGPRSTEFEFNLPFDE